MIANESSIVQHVIQIRNGIIKHVNVSVKIMISAKKIIAEILAHVFVKNITVTLVITCDEIIPVMGIVSRKMANTIATNMSINSYDEKTKHNIDFYIFQAVLLVIILLLIIAIICYLCKTQVKAKKH